MLLSQRAARPGGPQGGRDAHWTPELQCSALLLWTEGDRRLDAAQEPECLARVVSLHVHSKPSRQVMWGPHLYPMSRWRLEEVW